MHQGDHASYYQYPPNPNPNPSSVDPNLHQTTPYASLPPFSTHDYPSPYHPYYPQNPDPTPAPTLQPPFPSYDPHGPPNQTPTPSANQPPPYFPLFDHHQTAPVPPNPAPTSPPFASMYAPPYNSIGSSAPVSGPYNPGMGYFEDNYGDGYNRSLPDLGPGSGSDPYGKRAESAQYDDVYGDGVYQYNGGKAELYGARGTAPKSSTWSGFDDFGRPISFPSGNDSFSGGSVLDSGMAKIVRAVPKVEAQQDVKGGVQKFRVKLLAESAGQGTMDVLCQIGLDGIRMLDPNTIRTLRIYPLENITRCDKFDSSTFAFWSKSSAENEPKRIRLQSNSYTTNTLLDTVTAATVQIKEMGGRIRPTSKTTDQPAERKKGLVDWMNIIKPGNEEKDHWVPDEAVSKCTGCGSDFSAFVRRHHCRNCGDVFCDKCTQGRIALTAEENAQPVRVCDHCMAEVTHRLSNAKEAASQPAGLQSHEDLAKKLQDEMEKNRKSSGSMSNGSGGMQMKEVACPTCTVHLQVQVPASGSETIECGVCQHPFLVSAH